MNCLLLHDNILYLCWEIIIQLDANIVGSLSKRSLGVTMDDKDWRFLVLILYNSEFSINRPLLQTTNLAKENIYGDGSGKIFRILECSTGVSNPGSH